jgi:putative chitinase
MGIACKVDFEGNPDLVTDPQHALKPALQEWTEKGLNTFADKNNIRTVTLRINGGFNGLDERQGLFERVFRLLQPGGQPVEVWQAGEADGDMERIQEALNKLDADPKLAVDGPLWPGHPRSRETLSDRSRNSRRWRPRSGHRCRDPVGARQN